MNKGKAVISTLKELEGQRRPLVETWQRCFDLTVPERGNGFYFGDNDLNGYNNERKDPNDSTGADSVQLFASALMSGLTPANSKWFNLTLTDIDTNVLSGASRTWLQSAANTMFMFASHVQTLVPMLQTPDAKRMVGMAEMIGIGSMMYYVKEHAYNDEPDVGDWKKIIAEGVDRSGVFALPFEINNIVEKATHGTVGIRPTFGLGEAQRMRNVNVNVIGALAGPLAGMSSDVAIPVGHAFQGDITKGDVSRIARLAPYQNLFYTRWLTDQLKRDIQDKME